ncbi:MAG: adenylate/guanylate cyclase domain-containing protein [Saprospiraceae bacterium]
MIHGNTTTFRELSISIGYWNFVVFFYVIIRYWHPETLAHEGILTIVGHMIQRALIFGSVLGVIFHTMKSAVGHKNLTRLSYGKLIIYRSLSYIMVFLALIAVYSMIKVFNIYGLSNREAFRMDFFTADTIISIGAMLVFAALYDLLSQVALKFGKNNFWKMLIGRYHFPKEEEKIFMFLDLQSSTTIAEKLGHRKYSEFIQECFRDISVIGNYGGEVYQFVGDEAVFTWDAHETKSTKNSIEAFFAFQKRILTRNVFYKDRFDHVPVFKAGLHGGQVMVAEVGLLKKEIAFHGDTINTAARIQQMCNEKERIFLTSDYFKPVLEKSDKYSFEDMGDILLKGRQSVIKLYHPILSGS